MRYVMLIFVSVLSVLPAAELAKVVDEKDNYNFWDSEGFLWATLSFVVIVIGILITYKYEVKYLDENRPKKNIKLEE